MASTKVKAVVIGGVNVKEKDKLISLYTLEKGKMSVSMKGVRGDKAKLKSAKEIFSFGDFVVEEGRSTNIVIGADIIDNFYDLSKDIDKYYEGCAILDIVSKTQSEPNPQIFIEVVKALKTLCYDNVKKYYVIDKFLLSLFYNMGFWLKNAHPVAASFQCGFLILKWASLYVQPAAQLCVKRCQMPLTAL